VSLSWAKESEARPRFAVPCPGSVTVLTSNVEESARCPTGLSTIHLPLPEMLFPDVWCDANSMHQNTTHKVVVLFW